MKWKDKLFDELITHLAESNSDLILEHLTNTNYGVHLGVFSEPFISLIFKNVKTIESRFSINRIRPFGTIKEGDVVVIKITSGPICGCFIARNIRYFSKLGSSAISKLNDQYGKDILWNYDPGFLEDKVSSKFLTLMDITELKVIPPIEISKKDRISWLLLRDGLNNTLFEKNG